MKKSNEGQPDPRHPEKAQAAERLMRSESARAERAAKKEVRKKEEAKAVREGRERLIHGVSVNPSRPRPIPGATEHIEVGWHDKTDMFVHQIPTSESELDVAWAEAPLQEGSGRTFEFGDEVVEVDNEGRQSPMRVIDLENGVEVDLGDDNGIMVGLLHESLEVTSLDALREREERTDDLDFN